MMFADGCNNMNHCWNISIELEQEDTELLLKLSNLIYKDPEIAVEQVKTVDRTHQEGKGIYSKLCVNSKHICLLMQKMGVVPLKSLIIKYPEWMPDRLHRHFVRGYFDGDGTINNVDKAVSGCNMIATKEFCNTIKSLTSLLGIDSSIHHSSAYKNSDDEMKKDTNVYTVVFSGNRNIEKFLHWIYNDASIYMERKHKRYLSFIQKMKDVNTKIVAGTRGYSQTGLRYSNPELFEKKEISK